MLKSLISNIQDAIVLLDVNGAVVFESPSAAAVLGIRSDEVLRAFGMSRIHPDDRAAVVESFERLRAIPGYVFRASYRFQRADGDWCHLEALAKNLLDEHELNGILVTFRDVTERVRAIELAERATAARDEFLSRMSHELKTPLNAVIGWGRLLQQDGSELIVEAADQIVAAGNHLLGLISDALDLAAVQEGRVTMRIGPVSLRPLVTEMVDLVRPLASLRNISLDVAPAPATEPENAGTDDSPRAAGDGDRLRQVVLNLLSNAVKYGPADGRVEVGFRRGVATWRLYVRDEGPGIPDDLLGRLFERFERLGADSSDTEGSGLGLAISRRLMELMGGTIWVESTIGGGTTFWVELPAINGATPTQEQALQVTQPIPEPAQLAFQATPRTS